MRTFMNRLGSLKNKLLNLNRPAVRTGRRRTAISTLFLIPALLSASLLSGCHGQREQAAFTVPEEFDTSRNYEITFWAKNDTNVRQTDIYKQAIADFQELYPNITVNLRLYTDYGKIYNDVITNISTGTGPYRHLPDGRQRGGSAGRSFFR